MATIILISGNTPHAGKDTFATFLSKYIEFDSIKLSDPTLKDLCRDSFSELTEYVNNYLPYKTDFSNWYEDKNEFTRRVLQAVGGPILNSVNPLFLVSTLVEKITPDETGIYVVTDWRKRVEYEYINKFEEHSVITVRINRKIEDEKNNSKSMVERDLDNFTFDFIISNDGTLEELLEKAEEFSKILIESVD